MKRFLQKLTASLSLQNTPSISEVSWQEPFGYFCRRSAGAAGELFLDSGDDMEGRGRYSVVAVQPAFTVTFKNGMATFVVMGEPFRFYSSPITTLKNIFETLPKLGSAELPCFSGGVVALLPYELNEYLESRSFSRVGAAGEELWCGFYTRLTVFDRLEQRAWQINWQMEDKAEPVLHECKLLSYQLSPWQSDDSREVYMAKVEQLQKRISRGDCYQVNLSRRLTASLSGSALSFYADMRRQSPASYGAFINCGGFELLSISPELFFSVSGGKISSMPIKGTAPRHSNEQKDTKLRDALPESEKNRAENLMIVDLMRNDLSKICLPNSVAVPKLFQLESLPTMHHLVSTVKGQLKPDVSMMEILAAVFPGGSITGTPKIKAMEVIGELESSRRGFYCGSLVAAGFDGNITASILIRTAVVRGKKVEYRTGGGITADSNPAEEFEETEVKAVAVTRLASKVEGGDR